ncbi:MAG: ATP-binding protein [Chitinophagaceae bacterium]|nr:ATP-binding protein [Chitinophagaceae bacterium]
MNTQINFEPRARLLLQLGDQLIRNEGVALLELIKNSYDAYASKVSVIMKRIDDIDNGEIIIEDDGVGMNEDIFRNVWMQPGSDYKLRIITSIKKRVKSNRIPIGEKGIGRFGVHKLGNYIELISKTASDEEIAVKINWTDFEKNTTLNKVKIDFENRKRPIYFINGRSGTLIKIKKLKKDWDRASVRELYRSAISLNSPFASLDAFNVVFKLDNQEWLRGLIKFEDIKEYCLYKIEGIIENRLIKKLKYEFIPWDAMKKINGRKETLNNIKLIKEVKDEKTKRKKQVEINIGKYDIGPISIKLLIFDREPKVLNYGVSDKEGLRQYLDANGGIRVYRDGIRIFNYGEKDNDWLKLDIKRVNRPGENISNNIVIGAVELDRLKSLGLQEKTNREGFIENQVYETFHDAVNFFIEKVLSLRNVDKEKLRKLLGATSVSEPVVGRLKTLKEKINRIIPTGKKRDDILKTIKSIETDYKTIVDVYTRSSSAGLSLSIVIHEVEKIIDELVKAVDEIPTNKYLKDLIKTLDKTVTDYASVVRKSAKTKEDLILLISRAISNTQFRIKAHKIILITPYKDRVSSDTTVTCVASLFISSIMNIIDNSIWWMTYANRKVKKVYIDILNNYEPGYTSLLIADNGPGFSIPTEDAIKPFITDKPDGMGLGLHLVEVMMLGLKGKLIFPQEHDLDIPAEFQKGAKIILAFKK